jgi:hypothetical protein
MNLKQELKNNELTIKDLQVWNEDFTDVERIFETVKDRDLQGIIDRLNHTSGVGITSDTHEPLEYIDFNYGSLTCTITKDWQDEHIKLLTDGIEGYVRRDGIELAGYFTVDINEVREVLKECSAK